MKKLQMGELVYLEENREYVVVATVEKDNSSYAYLMTTEEPYIIKFAKEIYNEEKLDLEIVHNQELKEELLKLFQNKLGKLDI